MRLTARVIARAHLLGEPAQSFGIGAASAFGRGAEERRPFQCLARQVGEAGLEFRGELMLPPGENVGPSFDRVFVDRVFVEGNGTPPAIILDGLHRALVPARLADRPPFQHCRDDVVAVLENIRLHHHVLADDPLDRVATAVDQGRQVCDDGGGELAGHRHQLN